MTDPVAGYPPPPCTDCEYRALLNWVGGFVRWVPVRRCPVHADDDFREWDDA